MSDQPAKPKRESFYRHARATRITHWVNVLCIALLLMSGLNIFNAHPRLYWGQYGAEHDRPIVWIDAVGPPGKQRGMMVIGNLRIETTGLLGLSQENGHASRRAFPAWLTTPSQRDLGSARRWHFFFAWLFAINGLIYILFGVFNRHFVRDLTPTKEEIKPKHIWHDIVRHAQLKFPTGEAAKRYNILQKFAYLSVIALLLPTMVLTGLTMSPGFNAAAPVLLDIFGGRQSARTIHFISASLIVGFILVHLLMVFLAGPINEIRSMITGRYEIKPDPAPKAKVEAAP